MARGKRVEGELAGGVGSEDQGVWFTFRAATGSSVTIQKHDCDHTAELPMTIVLIHL